MMAPYTVWPGWETIVLGMTTCLAPLTPRWPNKVGRRTAIILHKMIPNRLFSARDDGHIYELFGKGNEPVWGWDLTAAAEGVPAARFSYYEAPLSYYHAATNTKHVIYGDNDGRLLLFWFCPLLRLYFSLLESLSKSSPICWISFVAFSITRGVELSHLCQASFSARIAASFFFSSSISCWLISSCCFMR